MAIDTAAKRRAAFGVGYQGLLGGPSLFPDLSKDVFWRAHSGRSYHPYVTASIGGPHLNCIVALSRNAADDVGLSRNEASAVGLALNHGCAVVVHGDIT